MARQGTDGARGEYIDSGFPSTDPRTLTNGDVGLYSLALTQVLTAETSDFPLIVVGRDTRTSGDTLKRFAVAGIEAGGGCPIDIGVAPTPAIQKIAVNLGAAGAISLTASHNPHTDAGWKGMFGAEKPSGEQIEQIEEQYQKSVGRKVLTTIELRTYDRENREQTHHVASYMSGILEDIRQTFGESHPLREKIVVVDAARGAASVVTPNLMEQLGARVVRFACDPTQGFINDGCGAAHLEGLQSFLRTRPELIEDENFIGAFANDGDADRFMGIGAAMSDGEPRFGTFDGNISLEIMATGLTDTLGLGVVSTEYVNPATVRRIEAMGLPFRMCKNGDANVTAMLRERGWPVGAEPSGHIIDLRRGIPSGDGVYSALWTAAYASMNSTTIWEIAREHPLDPDYQISVPFPLGTTCDPRALASFTERTAEDEANNAIIVVRPSGTEPIVRVRVSGLDDGLTRKRVKDIADAIAGSFKNPHKSSM